MVLDGTIIFADKNSMWTTTNIEPKMNNDKSCFEIANAASTSTIQMTDAHDCLDDLGLVPKTSKSKAENKKTELAKVDIYLELPSGTVGGIDYDDWDDCKLWDVVPLTIEVLSNYCPIDDIFTPATLSCH